MRASHPSTDRRPRLALHTGILAMTAMLLAPIAARADIQQIAPRTGPQNATVVSTGPDGICDTSAATGDIQAAPVGQGTPNQNVIRCGANKAVETAAAGDDTQLLAVGSPPPGTACVIAGANGIADTAANNAGLGGDDVQVIAQGAACAINQTVVDSGPNGIAETRAEGPDLVIAAAKSLKLAIRAGQLAVSKTVKVGVSNVEFGPSAPATRSYSLAVAAGSCGNGVVSQIDSDALASGLQSSAAVPLGSRVKGSFVRTFKLQNVLSVSRTAPFRCALTVRAQANDVSADLDDAANVENNETELQIEVYDYNDRI